VILQGLVKYYERKSIDPTSALAPFRWDEVEIPWLATFTENGKFFGFQSTQEGTAKSRRYKRFLVPVLGEKKGSGATLQPHGSM
jgi:CRISPR-associated protein Csd1